MANFLEKLSKEKLLGYFFILLGISFLVDGIGTIAYSSVNQLQLIQSLSVGYMSLIFGPILSIGMGIILVLLGYKIIKY